MKCGLFSKITKDEAKNINPVTLAFVGDAVYSLYVRHELVLTADFPAGKLQKLSADKVSAHGQSLLTEKISSKFTEDEEAVFRRGRNAKKSTRSKNASVVEYNISTGFEAVLGYLYLCGEYEEIERLLGEV